MWTTRPGCFARTHGGPLRRHGQLTADNDHLGRSDELDPTGSARRQRGRGHPPRPAQVQFDLTALVEGCVGEGSDGAAQLTLAEEHDRRVNGDSAEHHQDEDRSGDE
jgi:hypothetical protein